MDDVSTVYGPVDSWRLGRSLGVDLLCVNSVCSFRCVYCQLGRINVHTTERRVFVPTARVVSHLRASAWREAEVITFSGSGEPTLAANLGEAVRAAGELTGKPVVVLTNSAHLRDARVRRDLAAASQVFCKLDAAGEETFGALNRPAGGLTLGAVVEGVTRLRAEYAGRLAVQTMLVRGRVPPVAEFARLLDGIRPDEVQLNTPSRPVPRLWTPAARGNDAPRAARAVPFSPLPAAEAARFAADLRRLTGLPVLAHPQLGLDEAARAE